MKIKKAKAKSKRETTTHPRKSSAKEEIRYRINASPDDVVKALFQKPKGNKDKV